MADYVEIPEVDEKELTEALRDMRTDFIDRNILDNESELPDHLHEYDWISDEMHDPDWPRELARAISDHWKPVTEAQAAAALVHALIQIRPDELGEALAMHGTAEVSAFARTMNKVAPEFSQALAEKEAGSADIAVRMMFAKVFNAELSDPSDAFFVDAVAHAYADLYKLTATELTREILSSMVEMPDDATGFALVLAGTKGSFEVWLREPKKEALDVIVQLARDTFDEPDITPENIREHPNAVAAAAIGLCSTDIPHQMYEQMLGAVAQVLKIRGMLIVADPRSGCRHEALSNGSFHAVRGTDLLGLRDNLMSLPAVHRFRELMDLYEEMTDSFNERLVTMAASVSDDVS